MIEIKGKKILLLGLGLHGGGVATARWLHKHGAQIIVSDVRKKKLLEPSLVLLSKHGGVQYVLGKHRDRDVKWADYVVYNPGVPKESTYLQLARRLNKPVYNEASLFFDRCRAPIIAVTGTRGKSTTAALIASMCKQKNPRTILAGNIKTAFMLDVLDRATKHHLVVLELSSWQLEGLNIVRAAPPIAVITNLYPDHLNRYRNLAHYYTSKKEIFRHQRQENFLVLPNNDTLLSQWHKEASSHVLFFSKQMQKEDGVFVKAGRIISNSKGKQVVVASVKDIALFGEHNLENSLAAIAAARIYGVSSSGIKAALKKPMILSGRQEIIKEKNGITFVNDTTATTPEAGIAGLKRFSLSASGRVSKKKNIILIAGGADKKLLFGEWASAAKKYCKRVYLLSGDASKKQKIALAGFKHVDAFHTDLDVLLKKVFLEAQRGDIILFSPSAASFNVWLHEFDRGDNFVRAVSSL
ncbi:UDP-N-acetylmuramoylalanine--D-glutamate ligase [bacterium CG10_46_32]|nr:MAG: UDP-N-acetylmuramoylalanine--D-glutamate ligase [bacterium CG10_46_32]PIR56089.1 MAG: UDP-N-acetylmuramoyl-L-alanine--D-glutamate ligase [Parcubacteria group bacterium CG10_big_fil_rev_8_21_14_0_10_46_32]